MTTLTPSRTPEPSRGERMQPWTASIGVAALALALYWTTAAPGLTWLHQGADGGELLAAAMSNGVPHPPGYPLYTLLLQGWLGLTGALAPGSDLAWRGNLASGLAAAASAGLTVLVAGHLLPVTRWRWLWASLASLAWALSPLAWTQAVIAEVYSLHGFWMVWLGLAVLVYGRSARHVVLPIGFGMAHHLTFGLLLPAALFALAVQVKGPRRWLRIGGALSVGLLLAAILNLRTVIVAGNGPPPINWGYADQWNGFWWLLSGEAYRGYLFSAPLDSLLNRLAAWAATLTAQLTMPGMALALVGLASWDQKTPWLRNFSLLWLVPVSIYAIGYNTRDSDIYLLPVGWLMALWLAAGLDVVSTWLSVRWRRPQAGATLVAGLAVAGLLALGGWQWNRVGATDDRTAIEFVQEVARAAEPDAIIVSYNDQETFALWYGIWGSRTLAAQVPGIVALNEPLYQFPWYRRLQGDLHPGIPGITASVQAVIDENAASRPIYFTQPPTARAGFTAEQIGPLWRLQPQSP